MSDFSRALEILLKLEGGYSNDAMDPGGKTKFGITEAVARRHGYIGDMQDLQADFAGEIYRSDYWDACRCDQMPWPTSLFVFDSAVNQGADAAIRMLQRALDTVQDGVMGKQTQALMARAGKWQNARFLALRALRYQGTRNFDRFGHGWYTRLFELALEA